MNPDVIFVLGLFISALAVPAVISAFSTSDATLRPAAACIMLGGSLVLWAMTQSPSGYTLAEVPGIVVSLFR